MKASGLPCEAKHIHYKSLSKRGQYAKVVVVSENFTDKKLSFLAWGDTGKIVCGLHFIPVIYRNKALRFLEEKGMRDKLLEKIELLRQQMVKIGIEHGLDHPEVLLYSKKIDELHNELMRMDQGLSKASRKRKPYRFYIMESKAHFA